MLTCEKSTLRSAPGVQQACELPSPNVDGQQAVVYIDCVGKNQAASSVWQDTVSCGKRGYSL